VYPFGNKILGAAGMACRIRGAENNSPRELSLLAEKEQDKIIVSTMPSLVTGSDRVIDLPTSGYRKREAEALIGVNAIHKSPVLESRCI
jgi:hypothetical protein